jgi:YVTN family beta-propeller protein
MAPRTRDWFAHLSGRRMSQFALGLALAGATCVAACGDDGGDTTGSGGSGANGGNGGNGGDVGGGDVGGGGAGGGGAVLSRPSKSGSVAINEDDSLVVMVNPGDDSVTIFDTTDDFPVGKVTTGGEPSAVVIHPDGQTAFVANRADATVVKITGLGADATAGAPVAVGSEPTGLALSPTGARLFVAEHAEGRVSVIDTASMEVIDTIDGPVNPRGLAVTNDGDDEDDDELLIVPEFFGEAQPGGEAEDDGRRGRVRIYALSDLSAQNPIVLTPVDSGFGAPSVMTSPNQLYNVAVVGDRIFIPSVSASPAPPVSFNTNVQPVLYAADLSSFEQDNGELGTQNLARLVRDQITEPTDRLFMADIVDVAFVSDDIAYVVSRGANVVQRIEFNEATGVSIGSSFNDQIDLGPAPAGSADGCAGPTGIAINHAQDRAYVNCWVSRRLGVIDLPVQEQVKTVESSPAPSTAEAISVNRGLKFFTTGRARWSDGAWSACASCHPDGLTDNITWSFAAGPRQTVSLDGSFSHGPGAQQQRILNWTAIFDEIHDFERNTRGVSGGLGAVTQSTTCGDLASETPSAVPGPPSGLLGTPVKEIQDSQADNCTTDWDDIDAWVKTVRPPKALQAVAAADVTAGSAMFDQGGCAKCHGGSGWTASRRFWTPSSATNTSLTGTAFPESAFPVGFPAIWNEHTTEIGPEPGTGIVPFQVACAIRNVGSFGVPGDPQASAAVELKANGSTAQGEKGFNVPSLYGLALGAPYLHHGQAATLRDLFVDPTWQEHLQAGNAVFSPTEAEVDQLVAFLLSIDAAAEEKAIDAGFDVCRSSFP